MTCKQGLGFDLRRQAKPECRAVAGLAGDLDLAAVGARDFVADGQTQARPARANTAGAVGAPETLKDPLLLFGVQPDAVIANFEFQVLILKHPLYMNLCCLCVAGSGGGRGVCTAGVARGTC